MNNLLARLRWPLPALLTWGGAWAVFLALQKLGSPALWAMLGATLLGLALSLLVASWWRRAATGLGFPLSLALSGAVALPAWAWLAPLAVLLLIYPLKAWHDAPFFPTPAHALRGLADALPLAPAAKVLDAGCGLGDGLKALREAYPAAQLHGLEWSWLLRALCALRCPWARVQQGDIWQASWQPYHMVYLFQRPESMARAMEKASAELPAGAWLASLEFEAKTWQAQATFTCPDGRSVWLYQAPFKVKKSD